MESAAEFIYDASGKWTCRDEQLEALRPKLMQQGERFRAQLVERNTRNNLLDTVAVRGDSPGANLQPG